MGATVECVSQQACQQATGGLAQELGSADPIKQESCTAYNTTGGTEMKVTQLTWDPPSMDCPADNAAACAAVLDLEKAWVKACQGTSQATEATAEAKAEAKREPEWRWSETAFLIRNEPTDACHKALFLLGALSPSLRLCAGSGAATRTRPAC